MTMVKPMKKIITGLMLVLMSFMAMSFLAPTKAHASGIGDSSITISNDGKITTTGDLEKKSSGTAWTDFITKYRNFIVGVSGVGMVSMILFFMMNLLKLGATAGNPSERQKVLTGLIWSGVAAAGLGSVTTFVGFFYGIFAK